ncbi:MAG: tRNA (adenosine(37)-N6)-threonylcarbamoyltransferase complex dimerization subunit type 1 TsaB [Acidobacteriales bacterium]|nr:tRNA (adenosine(37)-N6)-threonylcarbamoyltransferase complex dimerization subunit type 1 TsaB [Terriglobales bacterium]
MYILAIDTSHQNGSVALAEGGGAVFRLIGQSIVEGGTFSAQLVPSIATLLGKHGLDLSKLGCLAACVGPGSFTGLRIGLAAIKGLAEVMHIPIVGVSTLEALAHHATRDGLILAASDARRSEVFTGEYRRTGGELRREAEYLCTAVEFTARIQACGPSEVVTSDARLAQLAGSVHAHVMTFSDPGSEAVARIGLAKFLRGETTSVDELDADYLRRDDNLFFPSARSS